MAQHVGDRVQQTGCRIVLISLGLVYYALNLRGDVTRVDQARTPTIAVVCEREAIDVQRRVRPLVRQNDEGVPRDSPVPVIPASNPRRGIGCRHDIADGIVRERLGLSGDRQATRTVVIAHGQPTRPIGAVERKVPDLILGVGVPGWISHRRRNTLY